VSFDQATGVVDVVRQQVSFEFVPGFVLIGVEIAVETVVHVIHAVVVVNWWRNKRKDWTEVLEGISRVVFITIQIVFLKKNHQKTSSDLSGHPIFSSNSQASFFRLSYQIALPFLQW
jgi:hypothetical protein